MRENILLDRLQRGERLSLAQEVKLCIGLSIPAMLAQVTTVVMEYADAAMVGALGKNATASIGLVASSTWLFGGLMSAGAIGFTVQAAQYLGGRRQKEARNLVKQAVFANLGLSVVLMAAMVLISGSLPGWVSDQQELFADATRYFLIFGLSLPMMQMSVLCGGMLQASGDMKTPSLLNILCCILNVFLNAVLIFEPGELVIPGVSLRFWGAGLGVAGAALGTALAEVMTGVVMMLILLFKSPTLKLRKGEKLQFHTDELKKAVKISLPVAVGNFLTSSAYVVSTKIVAPLGTAQVAAHSLAITAEGLCYMPGYGVAEAASTLVGQSIGAGSKRLAKKMAWLCTSLGVLFMACTGFLMYWFAPFMMSTLSPVREVQDLGVMVLRMEAFAEPLFAAAIVANGSLRGAGDTLVSSSMNFLSMWIIRLPLSAYLAGKYSLAGVWMAMRIELWFRGVIFLIRLARGKWLRKYNLDEKRNSTV